jgi:hypothetical protein
MIVCVGDRCSKPWTSTSQPMSTITPVVGQTSSSALRAELTRLRAENQRLKSIAANAGIVTPSPPPSTPISTPSSLPQASSPSTPLPATATRVVVLGTKKPWQFGEVETYKSSSEATSALSTSSSSSSCTSNKCGTEIKSLDLTTPPTSSTASTSTVTLIPWISKSQLRSMLIAENDIRLSSDMQARYREAEDSTTTDWMAVTIQMQRTLVCQQLGIDVQDEEKIGEALYALRTAHLQYPDDEEFRTIPLYIKYNITRFGSLLKGHDAPNVNMIPIRTSPDLASDGSVNTSLSVSIVLMSWWYAG